MIAVEMSKRHNITYIKWSPELKFKNFDFDLSEKISSLWYEGVYLQFYFGLTHHYCVDPNLRNSTAQLGYDTFIEPMPLIAWILLVINWLFVTILCTSTSEIFGASTLVESLTFELMNMFNLICCIGIQLRKSLRAMILISFGCIWFWSIYQNNILGLTIVEEKFKPFSTIEQFLSARYICTDFYGNKCKQKHFDADGKDLTDYDKVAQKIGW